MFMKENAWQAPDLSLIPRTTWHPKNLNEALGLRVPLSVALEFLNTDGMVLITPYSTSLKNAL